MTRCAVYARFSSEKQRDESIEDQERVCRMYAAANGMEVVAVYADRATSGTTDGRPSFQRLIADSAKGKWDTVLVYKLDRFARDRFDAALYRRKLKENGVSVVSAMESIPDTPEGIILESVIDGMNEYYSRNLAQNVKRGMRGNAEKRKANGVRVFGYRESGDGTYLMDAEQAALVRKAFAMSDCGATNKEICDWLNERSRNTRGKPWSLSTVAAMLHNEKYAGVYSFGDVRIEGGMPAIVDEQLFRRVSAKGRKKPRRNSYPLSGKLFDDATGTPYHGTSGTGYQGEKYFYYGMPLGDGHERRYPKTDVEDAVLDVLHVECSGEWAEKIADFVMDYLRDAESAVDGESLAKERAAIEKRRERLLDALEAGLDPKSVKERLAALDEEERSLEKKAASFGMPRRSEVLDLLRNRFIDSDRDRALRTMVGGCTIDDRGWVRVSMPLPEWCPSEPENECEPAGRLRVRKDWFGSRRTFYHEVGLACGRLTVRACVPLLTAGKARMLSREEGSLRRELERLMAEDLFK